MRLAGGIADHRLALRERGRHDRVLGRHHAGLVEEDPPAAKPFGLHLVAAVDVDACSELGERMDMRVEPAAPDHVAAGRRHRRAAGPSEQRAGEQERRANPAGELFVDVRGGEIRSLHSHLVRARPVGVGPEPHEQLDHRLDVADPRDVAQGHRLVGEQAPGEDR